MEPQVLMTWSPLLGSVNGDHQLRRDLAAQDDELVVLLRQDEWPIVEAPPSAAPGAVGHVVIPEGLEDGYVGADDAHGGVLERDAMTWRVRPSPRKRRGGLWLVSQVRL